MQKILEQRLLLSSGSTPARKYCGHPLWVLLVCTLPAAYIALVVLPKVSSSTFGDDDSSTPSRLLTAAPPSTTLGAALHVDTIPFHLRAKDMGVLVPWGYNKERNEPRWRGILASILSDFTTHRGRFSLVDYGSDQGYFSISAAAPFPDAVVMGVEIGGFGGEIWSRKRRDVLEVQEEKLQEHRVLNVVICQAKLSVNHFQLLNEAHLVADYQLVLSVFHWFELPTRKAFEAALVEALRGAKTTFLELPCIGDGGPLVQKQVGYKNFVKWYDGRKDIGQVIREAASAHHLDVAVQMLVAVPWIRWKREVYRVDLREVVNFDSPSSKMQSFGCSQRQKIYGCAPRAKYNTCGGTWNA